MLSMTLKKVSFLLLAATCQESNTLNCAAFAEQAMSSSAVKLLDSLTHSNICNPAITAVVCGVAAWVFVRNIQKGPISGRLRFLLSKEPVSNSRPEPSLPSVVYAIPSHEHSRELQQLHQQGINCLAASYRLAAAGVSSLAQYDMQLRQQLFHLPDVVLLTHNTHSCCRDGIATEQNIETRRATARYMTGSSSPIAPLQISISAEQMQSHTDHRSLVREIACQLAPSLAAHGLETASWRFLLSSVSCGIALSSPCLLSASAAASFFLLMTERLIIQRWLTRKQEREAGCIADAIVQAAVPCAGMQTNLANLQLLVPQLHADSACLSDHSSLQLLLSRAGVEATLSSQEVREQVEALVRQLQVQLDSMIPVCGGVNIAFQLANDPASVQLQSNFKRFVRSRRRQAVMQHLEQG